MIKGTDNIHEAIEKVAKKKDNTLRNTAIAAAVGIPAAALGGRALLKRLRKKPIKPMRSYKEEMAHRAARRKKGFEVADLEYPDLEVANLEKANLDTFKP